VQDDVTPPRASTTDGCDSNRRIGPLGYLALTMSALNEHWSTPWVWPARPPHDHGAAICAGLVFAAGLAVVTVRGARAWFR
jgi:hypothetical protein